MSYVVMASQILSSSFFQTEKFTIDNGRMTHSNKLARPVLDRHYRTAINDLLTSLRAAPAPSKGSAEKVCSRASHLLR